MEAGHRNRTVKRRRHRGRRGGGYGFGGSILSDAGGANAGAARWDGGSTGCGGAEVAGRGGNNTLAGGRRRRRNKGGRRTRRRRSSLRGGDPKMALQVPRVGYGYTGTGTAGLTDPSPYGGNSVRV